jgi:hypothetical protein
MLLNTNAPRSWALAAAITIAVIAVGAATARASQPSDESGRVPEAIRSYPPAARYYGAIDPNPIGYYPHAYYQGSAFPVQRQIGYYPYPDAHPVARGLFTPASQAGVGGGARSIRTDPGSSAARPSGAGPRWQPRTVSPDFFGVLRFLF